MHPIRSLLPTGIPVIVSLFFLLLSASSVPAAETITVGGVGSSLGTMRKLARAFEKLHSDIRVEVIPSLGSSGGIRAVSEGAIDIGLSSRPLRNGERERGAYESEYARTPFIFVTTNMHAKGVTTDDLVEIYEGKKVAWPDGTRIRLVLRPAADTDTSILKGISPAMDRAVDSALARKGMIMAITNQESDETVEKTPGSLGASTMTEFLSEARSYRILSFNGAAPSLQTLAGGSYALSKSFYFVTTARTSETARRFISFVRSPEGIVILEDNGNLYVSPSMH